MLSADIYIRRRNQLKKQIRSGIVLFLGNDESPINFADNPYRFRQDSSFLYFFGLDMPGLSAVIDIDQDEDILFGNDIDVSDIIWMGPQIMLKARAQEVGVNRTCSTGELESFLNVCLNQRRNIHFLPSYRWETQLKIQNLLGIQPAAANNYASIALIKAVIEQRSVKIQEEIDEIEAALEITCEMQTAVMRMVRPGLNEKEIAGHIEGIALTHGCPLAFPMILTVNGQILHNHYQGNVLKKGQMLVNDSGSESPLRYASDVTRTVPVDKRFTQEQKDIYDLVLKAQETAIQSIEPGIKYRDIHAKTARIIAQGLKDLDFLRGDIDKILAAGAHALYFPHGLGHLLGLDVHDMESLGEDYIGYDEKTARSDQFGFSQLRYGKELKANLVLTVEPGIYFIPALIDKWRSERKHEAFINYDKAEQFKSFGGIRIEDDVLVTQTGSRVLGRAIPKKIDEIERMKD
jgi:Xaa-Pro aminopeptidase